LPYGGATDGSQARPAMAGKRNNRPAGGWGDAVRAAWFCQRSRQLS
jgi:hypothetical protein